MSAYVIVDLQITDPQAYEDYKAQVPASIAAYGGRYLVRGGASETLEGSWTPQRVVVIEFDDIGQAKAWRNAAENQFLHEMRQRFAHSNMIVVEGIN